MIGNVVTGNAYTGAGTLAAGILLVGGAYYGYAYVTGVTVVGNTLNGNDVGIYVGNTPADEYSAPAVRTDNTVVNNAITTTRSRTTR